MWLAYSCGACLVRHEYLMVKHALIMSLFMWCMSPRVFDDKRALVTCGAPRVACDEFACVVHV